VPPSPLSVNWYRVEALRPRLRNHALMHRQQYRGETWYVLQDRSSTRYHRLSPTAHHLVRLLDGQRTVEEVWTLALARFGDDAIAQDEVIELLAQLHAADVLVCDVPPDAEELFRRRERQAQDKRRKRALSLFAWQIPLYDPERLVEFLHPLARAVFSGMGLALWTTTVAIAAVLTVSHWPELTGDLRDRVLLPGNLIALWLLFPLVKALHELGHALAVKRYGGEVHESGVMLLVLTPVPYVDASSSWVFASKWQRFLVGAAGMMVELFLASLALFLWLAVEPGPVRAAAFNVMLIAGVSTVLFNANPLMRFDGYYMLMDLLEIPNLKGRAVRHFAYLVERHLLGRREAEAPLATRGERAWFVAYGAASSLYRIAVVAGLLLLLGELDLLLGAVFAAVTAVVWIIVPTAKAAHYLFVGPRLRAVRSRAVLAATGIAGMVLALLVAIPVPFRASAEGVVWVPDEGLVRAGADCFVERVTVGAGSTVSTGDVLIECRDPDLVAESAVLEGKLAELDARHREAHLSEPVKAQMIAEERQYAASSLARAKERLAELSIRAKTTGQFVLPRANDLPGRYVSKGELIAHVVGRDETMIRTIVTQRDIDLIRNLTQRVQVRLADRIPDVLEAKVKRFVPSAITELPSAALGSTGGGRVAVDPADRGGRNALEKHFVVDIDLPARPDVAGIGGRAFVRFDLGWEPIGWQWARRARQLFLSRLNV